MGDVTWEWSLPETFVRATLDARRTSESVWVGARLVSRVPAGSRPDGHEATLPGGEPVKVIFDVATPACALFVAGQMVPPSRAMVAAKRNPLVWVGAGAVALLGFVLAVSVAVRSVKQLSTITGGPKPTAQDYVLSRSLATPDGSLVAHFPASFNGTVGKAEAGKYVSLNIARNGGASTVGLVAIFVPVSDDLRELDRLVVAGVGTEWSKAGMTWEKTSHHAGTCLGEPGEITEGKVTKYLITLKTWQCTFLRDGEGFHFFYLTAGGGNEEEEQVLHLILEATEIRKPGD